MARYTGRRRGGKRAAGKHAAFRHVDAYRALERRLGCIVGDVRELLFGLPPTRLRALLDAYEVRHGTSARAYAERTMPRWRSGATKLSGQTAERMIDLLPRQLTTAQRYRLVERLCAHHLSAASYRVSVRADAPAAGMRELDEALRALTEVPALKYLPEAVLATVRWLNDDDAQATRALLSELDRRRNVIVGEAARREYARIKGIVARTDGASAKQRIDLATGRIDVHVYRPRPSLWQRLFG